MKSNILDFDKALLKKEIAQLEADIDNPDSEFWAGYKDFCRDQKWEI